MRALQDTEAMIAGKTTTTAAEEEVNWIEK